MTKVSGIVAVIWVLLSGQWPMDGTPAWTWYIIGSRAAGWRAMITSNYEAEAAHASAQPLQVHLPCLPNIRKG